MHTSIVGIGVDFNANLINQITAVRGANYYSVYSADQFEQRLVEEFEYMVTPLVFDLSLELDAEGYDIEQVYGSPSAEEATGELMGVSTLFPSPSEDGKAKGCVVLVQVERTGDGQAVGDMELQASWKERDGSQGSATETVSFPTASEHWGTDAVRKAVLLARHANLLKQWALEERDPEDVVEAYPDDEEGIAGTDADFSPAWRTVGLFIPIYNFIVIWRTCHDCEAVTDQDGVILFILWMVFVPAFWYLVQTGINDVAESAD